MPQLYPQLLFELFYQSSHCFNESKREGGKEEKSQETCHNNVYTSFGDKGRVI